MKKTKLSSKLLVMLMILAMVLASVPMSASAATYGVLEVSIPTGEDMSLSYVSTSGTTYTFNAVCAISGVYPYNFSLRITPDTGASVTSTTVSNGGYVTYDSGDYYLVTLPDGYTSVVTITGTYGGNTYTYLINCSAPSGGTSSGTGVYAYLPGAGQFANEGAGTGGWGSIFNSGSTALKGMVNAISSTGVSLGFFGGYAVLDMGENISNSNKNPYGVDFIVYGNAFSGNSEAGCLQVAQAVASGSSVVPGDANNDGIVWYNIAGSLHYNSSTVWNASYTYTNPTPGDDTTTTWPTSGTIKTNGVPYTYSNVSRPGDSTVTGSGTVTYNTFHQHSWFPLYANYFVARNSIEPMDKTAFLPFAGYNRDTTNGSTITLTGVMLGSATNTTTANYTFGYADAHPNGSNYGQASNPYIASTSTSGGDGIDISWAVNPNTGEPVNLTNIRFVRVYTGAAYMNGAFGEISTELCGVYKPTNQASSAIAATGFATVTVSGLTPVDNILATDILKETTITVPSGTNTITPTLTHATALRLYGETSSSSTLISSGSTITFNRTDGATQYARIIAQGLSGTDNARASVIVLKVVFS